MVTSPNRRRLSSSDDTPINRAALPSPPAVAANQILGNPNALPREMKAARERLYACAMAGRFDRWFLKFVGASGIPLDNVCGPMPGRRGPGERELLHLLLEAFLLAVAQWPGSRTVPCLPVCGGTDDVGSPCPNLRCYGHLLCPDCESADDAEELTAPRTEAEARRAGLTIRRAR